MGKAHSVHLLLLVEAHRKTVLISAKARLDRGHGGTS